MDSLLGPGPVHHHDPGTWNQVRQTLACRLFVEEMEEEQWLECLQRGISIKRELVAEPFKALSKTGILQFSKSYLNKMGHVCFPLKGSADLGQLMTAKRCGSEYPHCVNSVSNSAYMGCHQHQRMKVLPPLESPRQSGQAEPDSGKASLSPRSQEVMPVLV